MDKKPVKRCFVMGSMLVIGTFVLCSFQLFAAEQTAHLTFEKGKISGKDVYTHTITQGETLYSLVSSAYEPGSNRIRTLIYDAIQQLNPRLKNLDLIYTGQKIRLPQKHLFTGGRAATVTGKSMGSDEVEVAPPDPPLPASNYRIAVMKEIITRMQGTLSTTGNYYIPLPQSGQISIDCRRIPVVELPDGSVILLDFSQRMTASLKKMIPASLPHYHVVSTSLNEESPRILQKVMAASRTYSIAKTNKPLDVGTVPKLQIGQGWLISEELTKGERKALQLVTFLKDRQELLPKAFVADAKRNDLVITDVIAGQGVGEPPAILRPAPSVPDLQSSAHLDLVENLLSVFKLQASRNTDVRIFEQSRDGFNLSVKADLMVPQGGRRTIFHTTPVAPEFNNILRENGIEPVFLSPSDSRRVAIEKTLAGLGISFSSNVFSFSFPKASKKPRGVIRFPAIRMVANKSAQYLVDFDMDHNLYQLLHHQWGVNLIRY